MTETYLFDFDGTLVDSVPLIIESYRFATSKELGMVYPDEAYKAVIGLRLPLACRRLVGDDAKADRVMAAYIDHNMLIHDEKLRAFAGVEAVLEELQVRGRQLAVVTSKRREHTIRGLRVCKLERFFDVLVSADDVKQGKPDPECVHKALTQLQKEPASAVMIGDSEHDVTAGRLAGTKTAYVTWGAGGPDSEAKAQADQVCHEVRELLEL